MSGNPSILFRCDASTEIGLGHVVRCLALADELRDTHNCEIAFAMRWGPLGFEMVQQKGYALSTPPDEGESFDYARWLIRTASNVCTQALVLDVRDDLPQPTLETLRKRGVLIVTLDDPSERRLLADLAFYPPVPQVKRLNWDGFTGQLYVGWEWVVLRREFSQRLPQLPHERPLVLVTMGGSDPAGLTLKAIKALDLLDEDFETVVLLGPGFAHDEILDQLLTNTRRRFDVRKNLTDLPQVMAQADLAVASFGVTAYELAALGVPAIYLCLTEDHAESASVFQKEGIGISLGVYTEISQSVLSDQVKELLSDERLRASMTAHAYNTACGNGVHNIAQKIMSRIQGDS